MVLSLATYCSSQVMGNVISSLSVSFFYVSHVLSLIYLFFFSTLFYCPSFPAHYFQKFVFLLIDAKLVALLIQYCVEQNKISLISELHYICFISQVLCLVFFRDIFYYIQPLLFCTFWLLTDHFFCVCLFTVISHLLSIYITQTFFLLWRVQVAAYDH